MILDFWFFARPSKLTGRPEYFLHGEAYSLARAESLLHGSWPWKTLEGHLLGQESFEKEFEIQLQPKILKPNPIQKTSFLSVKRRRFRHVLII